MSKLTNIQNEIKSILETHKLVDIQKPLESKGFKVERNSGDMPMPPLWFEISKDGEEYTVVNKNYIEEGTEAFTIGEIAVG